MSPSKSQSLNQLSSCIQINSQKRSISKTAESSNSEYDIKCKKKKSDEHSVEDINNAVLTASNGYMTRRRFQEQLESSKKSKPKHQEKKEFLENEKPSSNFGKAKRIRKPLEEKAKKKLLLGYIFSHDIISSPYPVKQVTTHKNKGLSLFESDSEPETDCIQINGNAKNEVQSSNSIPKLEYIHCVFNKNARVKTYFNKKSSSLINKVNLTISNAKEEIGQNDLSSSIINNCSDNNLSEIMLDKSMKISSPVSNICIEENIKEDNSFIISEDYIKQLEKELQMDVKVPQGVSSIQEMCYDTSTIELNESNIEQLKDNGLISHKFDVLPLDYKINPSKICTVRPNAVDDIIKKKINLSSGNNLIEQDTNSNAFVKPELLLTKTTNNTDDNLLSIFDLPKDDTFEKSDVNMNENVISYSESVMLTNISKAIIEPNNLLMNKFDTNNLDQSLKKHLLTQKYLDVEEKNISPKIYDYHNKISPNSNFSDSVSNQCLDNLTIDKKKKFEIFVSKTKNSSLISDDNIMFNVDNSSKTNLNVDHKCQCKIPYTFNQDANTILTSKTKHFAFNNDAEKLRLKYLYQKNLDANNLQKIMTEDTKNIQLQRLVPQFNPILVGYDNKNCNNPKENNHIEPDVLEMLKDVYVDFEYLSEYSMSEKVDDNTVLPIIKTNNKSCEDSIINFDNNDTSTNISKEKELFDNPNPCQVNDVDFDANKCSILDENTTSLNIATTYKCDKNYVDFGKNHISDDTIAKNITTKNNLTENSKPCGFSSFILPKTNDDTIILDVTTKSKPYDNLKYFDEAYVDFGKIEIDTNNVENKFEILKDTENLQLCKFPEMKPKFINQTEMNYAVFNSTMKNNANDLNSEQFFKTNSKFDTKCLIKIEEANCSANGKNSDLIIDNRKYSPGIEIKSSEFCQSSNMIIKDENYYSKDHISPPNNSILSENPNNCVFDESKDDYENLINNTSSDEDDRLEIDEDNYDGDNTNITYIDTLIDKSKDSTTTDNLSLLKNIKSDTVCENNLMTTNIKQSIEISNTKDDIILKPRLSNNKLENICLSKDKNNIPVDCSTLTLGLCDLYFDKKLLSYENNHFSSDIKNIFKSINLDNIIVPVCQHMVENGYDANNDDVMLKNVESEKMVVGALNTENDKKLDLELNQTMLFNDEQIIDLQNKNSSKPAAKTKNLNKKSNTKPNNTKSNMKIRILFREFIQSEKNFNEILESKEFRSLRYFSEEEIASSIGVLLFERSINPPLISGLLVYRENFDLINDCEKNKLLRSTQLRINCPKITKLSFITLALAKMLGSNSLIDLILGVIQNNLFNKQVNLDHENNHRLETQIAYFVSICVRLGRLKTLQAFIFDSIACIPNKFCCVIFISLLLWKNCLPRRINDQEDPVIIKALSYLIAKKKIYSEQTVGCDIYQRELIVLMSIHFNYLFDGDLPVNVIQDIHKPDFFVSVLMILKCSRPIDKVEFIINCLFPIIEQYLNTQINEISAVKIMEIISMAIKPFKVCCNATVATYLNKCKSSIMSSNKNEREHFYNIEYNSYKVMQNIFIENFNNHRPRSHSFEESLLSIIMLLGSVDYLASCMTLLKWKPTFKPSNILIKKFSIFKSVLGHNLWNRLSLENDMDTIKNLVNSCLLKKDPYNTLIKLQTIH